MTMLTHLTFAWTLLLALGPGTTTPQETARKFVETLASGDTRSAMKGFSPTLARRVSPELLEKDWKEHVRQVGAFRRIVDARQEIKNKAQLVTLDCQFENGNAELWVAVDPATGQLLGVGGFRNIPSQTKAAVEARGRSLVESLHRGEYALASKDFDAAMRAGLPPQKLEATWKALLSQAGDFRAIDEVRVASEGPYYSAYVTCGFARKRMTVKVVLARTGTEASQVAGLFILPAEPCCGQADSSS